MPRDDSTADPRGGKGRVPAGLVGVVAFLVLVEGGLGRRGAAPRDQMSTTWQAAARWSGGAESRVGLLCLGDSLVKEGVMPRELGRRLGLLAYNLAVPGGSAPSSFFLLRRAIRAGAWPRAVVVDFHPNLLSAAPGSELQYWSDLLDLGEAIDLGWNSGDPRLTLRTLALAAFPSVKNREAIRSWVASALRGGADENMLLARALERNLRENRGALVWPVRPPPADPGATFRRKPDLGKWTPHRANVAYMHRLFSLAERSGVTVFWLLPPCSPTWQARRQEIGAETTYEGLARGMLSAHRNLVIVDGRFAGYGTSSFYDLTHLHAEGATELTAGLAGVLEPYLSATPTTRQATWASLPPFRGLPRDRGLEDFDQSKLAVSAGGPLRR